MVQPDSQLFTFGVAWVLCEAAGLAGGLVEGFSALVEALVALIDLDGFDVFNCCMDQWD